MRCNDDYLGFRVLIISGKYRQKKGHVSAASKFGIYVDLDYNGLRVRCESNEILIILDDGTIDT